MMTLKEIRQELNGMNLAFVARSVGMSRQKLWAIATGLTANPSVLTAEKISDYLESRRREISQ